MQIANDFTALTTDLVWRDDFGNPRSDITFGFADRPFAHHIPETTPQMRASVQALTPADLRPLHAALLEARLDVTGERVHRLVVVVVCVEALEGQVGHRGLLVEGRPAY